MLKKLDYIFDKSSKITLVWLLLLIIIGSFFEMIGVTVFMPFIELIVDNESLQTNSFLQNMFTIFPILSLQGQIAFVAILIIIFYIVKNIYLSFIWRPSAFM